MGDKYGRCIGLTNILPPCADCHEITSTSLNPQGPSSPVQRLLCSTQLLPLFTVIPRQLFYLQNIKHISLIYFTLITLTTLFVSLCSVLFSLFLLPARWVAIFFFGYLPSIYDFSLDSDIEFHTHKNHTKFLMTIALENLPGKKTYKKETYDNFYTTPKVFTQKRRKSKTKEMYVSCEHKCNYKIFNRTIRYNFMENVILIKY